MDDKKVSIVVPCYNQANYLMDTLNSIYRQTYSNWECIIVNDGSEDETHLIAEEYVFYPCTKITNTTLEHVIEVVIARIDNKIILNDRDKDILIPELPKE